MSQTHFTAPRCSASPRYFQQIPWQTSLVKIPTQIDLLPCFDNRNFEHKPTKNCTPTPYKCIRCVFWTGDWLGSYSYGGLGGQQGGDTRRDQRRGQGKPTRRTRRPVTTAMASQEQQLLSSRQQHFCHFGCCCYLQQQILLCCAGRFYERKCLSIDIYSSINPASRADQWRCAPDILLLIFTS